MNRIKDGVVTRLFCKTGNLGANFTDVWGDENGDVLFVGEEPNTEVEDILNGIVYRAHPDGTIEKILHLPQPITSIWGYQNTWYMCTVDKLICLEGNMLKTVYTSETMAKKVRGNSNNDLFVTDYTNTVIHWNGSTWQRIYNSELAPIFITSIAVVGNTVFVGGITDGGQFPVILTGRRN